ncbi:MAG: 2-iminoacetate synthase [Moorella sp. (in: firmicutes)]|uniref:[FeFe] hydrogenase H-cluster radical SAM maturase HydG n=1 Tax=unclassified Neomoorella TaxID=2676739 RepID=UPI0010FFB7E0|nr:MULTISPECIES: [FeFe] hydrogenase H-cluster radical SAM maturase HydG [unclassified Moorella (in: firmicutes)]MDK2816448.1 2-iminoacetate synthase [Moorella sp. (in: firmicutes)]GEA16157.1 [FeFe] hydrogenase H-cluster radical SAM maturase HydG [Moorella sp. E308F]GEA18998.1 [FeFe] hydrogenase H-cluster radical SAM maturase HydG [Moorella sp. E306M]
MQYGYRADFIKHEEIEGYLEEAKRATRDEAARIVAKAREAKGLEPYEVAVLLQNDDTGVRRQMFAAAREIKEKIYGRRMVLFAPLYFSDYCVNNCRYCGYRRENKFERRRLEPAELEREVRILESLGHKRLALEAGEDPVHCPLDYVLDVINRVYHITEANGNIRRVNVNIAATTVDAYRRLKEAGIGTYILFQETYHRPTYAYMHPSGPKADYDWHTTAMDRAMEGGIDDVGLGVLFGLYDYKFEVMGLLYHARHLEQTFGVGPHTISVPRLRPAYGISLENFPYLVNDDDFKKLVAIIRLAVPYTGMIISTRETPELRAELLALGISQLSAGSCTGVGGYSRHYAENSDDVPQFEIGDHRHPDEVIRDLCQRGYLPSYCTACYRRGRTGDRFMALAKTGEIQHVCQPNAILTFKEYLLDYAGPATREAGEAAIREHLAQIPSAAIRAETERRLERIASGERDLYF